MTRAESPESTGFKLQGRPTASGLLFAFCLHHDIIIFNAEKVKECCYMTEKKKTMARILALVIAGVMTLSVVLAIVLK